MAKDSIVKGATSVLDEIFIQDSSSTTGAGLTGLSSASSGLVCYRGRDDDGNAGGTAITLTSTGTLGTWASGWFKEKDATNMPGVYEIGYTNASLATGSRRVTIYFKGATNMAPLVLQIKLTGTDDQDAVRGGMTALPNANAEAAGGLYTRGTGAGQIKQTNNGEIDSNATHINNVATTSVTTVNANQGTTQPVNFTGTGSSALAKTDIVDILGTAISTPATAGVLDINVKNWANGTVATPLNTGYPVVDTVKLSGTSIIGIGTRVADGFVNFFNIASPTATMNMITNINTATNTGVAPGANGGLPIIGSNSGGISFSNPVAFDGGFTVGGTAIDVVVGNGVWDVAMTNHLNSGSTGATLNAAGSAGDPWVTALPGSYTSGQAGYVVGNLLSSIVLRYNTATASGSNTLTLDSGAPATLDYFKDCWLVIRSGTGVGQSRRISGYSTGRVATVSPPWATTPSSTSTFAILASARVDTDSIGGTDQTATDLGAINVTNLNTLSSHDPGGTLAGFALIGTGGVSLTALATSTQATNISSDTAAILTRIGAFAGSGVNTILGFFKALLRKDASTPSDLGGTYNPATDSNEALQELIAAGSFTLSSAYDFAKGTVAMTESYAANGVAPTPIQAFYAIHQMLMDFTISGTSYTVKRLNNSTTAFVVTLDSATTPTAASRT